MLLASVTALYIYRWEILMCVVSNRREQTLTISSFNNIRLTSVWKNNNPQVCFIELGRELEKL